MAVVDGLFASLVPLTSADGFVSPQRRRPAAPPHRCLSPVPILRPRRCLTPRREQLYELADGTEVKRTGFQILTSLMVSGSKSNALFYKTSGPDADKLDEKVLSVYYTPSMEA